MERLLALLKDEGYSEFGDYGLKVEGWNIGLIAYLMAQVRSKDTQPERRVRIPADRHLFFIVLVGGNILVIETTVGKHSIDEKLDLFVRNEPSIRIGSIFDLGNHGK
jgi:hypothetical protein